MPMPTVEQYTQVRMTMVMLQVLIMQEIYQSEFLIKLQTQACALYDGPLPEYEINEAGIMVLCKACYTDFTRKEDFRKHEQELKEEYEKRNNDTKINLSAQYKPILIVAFDSNYIDDIKFGMSKRPKFYIENTLSLNGKMEIQFNKKRISISLYVLNIGRGEANNIKISSLILDSKGGTWDVANKRRSTEVNS